MKYTKKQITEAIAHWTKVLEDLDNGQRDVSISLDFVTEKPYIKGKYQGEYTPDEFQQLCRSWEKKYGISISMAIPGESSASATGIISGPESAVRKFVDEVYDARTVHDPRMSDEEWKDILGETLENDPDTKSIIENARENVANINEMLATYVASINEMIAEIEKNGSTPLNAEILGSIVEFNDWCQEQMDKNGIS